MPSIGKDKIYNMGGGMEYINCDCVGKCNGYPETNLFDSERWYNELKTVDSSNISKEIVDGYEYYKIKPGNIYLYQFMKDEFEENTQYKLSFLGRQYDAETISAGLKIVYTDGTVSDLFPLGILTEDEYELTTSVNKTISYIRLYYAYNNFVLLRNIRLEKVV